MNTYQMQVKNEKELLAEEILDLVKAAIMTKWDFFNTAIGQFQYVRNDNLLSLGTDGRNLYYSLSYIWKQYRHSSDKLTGDFLHVVIHCVLKHPFIRRDILVDYWNLATDLVTENILFEVMEDSRNYFSEEAKKVLNDIRNCVKIFTAERVYEYLLVHVSREALTDDLTRWFFRDCHDYWYQGSEAFEEKVEGDSEIKSQESSDLVANNCNRDRNTNEKNDNSTVSKQIDQDGNERTSGRESLSEGMQQSDNGGLPPVRQEELNAKANNAYDHGQADREANLEEDTADGGKTMRKTAEEESDISDMTRNSSDSHYEDGRTFDEEDNIRQQEGMDFNQEDIKKLWEKVGHQVQVSMEMFHHKEEKADFLMNLKETHRDKVDYAMLLKRLSVIGEAMKINNEEFDYIWYSYGLSLYRNIPLIEPLEYKEIKAIKEFVIAIDTSASCRGELVKQFIAKTYSLLKQQESFFSKVNIHILQCDEKVWTDCKITNQEELDRYIDGLILYGFGDTDFRPVFSYIDGLIANKEFHNLKGIVYLTDGMGIFPKRKPSYQTIFAFVDGMGDEVKLPEWVMPIVLSDIDLHLIDKKQGKGGDDT
jgi:predicted metal-dependent peptidase